MNIKGKRIIILLTGLLSIILYYVADKHVLLNALFVTVFSFFVIALFDQRKIQNTLLKTIGESSYAIYLCEGILIYLWQDYYYFDNYGLRVLYCMVILTIGFIIHKVYKTIIGLFAA